MLNIGPQATAMLARNHGVTGRLRASVNGSAFTYPVNMLKGEVEVSGSSNIRRKLKATIAASIDSPEVDTFRTELRAEYGIYLNSQEIVWIPQGTFVVEEANEGSQGEIEITAPDRWHRVANSRFLMPETTSGRHVDEIIRLLQGADGRIVAQDFTGRTSTHNASLWERDRDTAVTDLAKAIGATVYFNPMGVAEIREEPSLASEVAWTVQGGDGGTLIDAKRGRKQGNTYNAVVAEGEAPDGGAAVRAIAYIDDPASPIYWGGPFGFRPRFYRSSLMTTEAQCLQAAQSMLHKASGISKTLDLDTFPHPGLDAGDVVQVETAPGVWERHIVDSFTLPLGPGGVSLTTRTSSDEAATEES